MRFIMLVVLIDMLAVGLIVPVLPAAGGAVHRRPAEQTFWYGVVTFTYALASFVGAPVLGALSDRYGRRPVLLLGFCGLALNFFATALATASGCWWRRAWWAAPCRPMPRWPTPTWPTSRRRAERAKRFGMLGAMFGLGFILGPVMGGLLGGIDLQLPFFVAGGAGAGSTWPTATSCCPSPCRPAPAPAGGLVARQPAVVRSSNWRG
jgi:DHA1 family tetracycline resistance protein-like MFS transporter